MEGGECMSGESLSLPHTKVRHVSELKGGVQCIDCGAFQEEGDPPPIVCRCGTLYTVWEDVKASQQTAKE